MALRQVGVQHGADFFIDNVKVPGRIIKGAIESMAEESHHNLHDLLQYNKRREMIGIY